MSEGFDSTYVPAEGESTYKDGHLYMFEARCDKCNMEVTGPERFFKRECCPKCGSTYWVCHREGFWMEVDEGSGDLIMIPRAGGCLPAL